MTRDTAGEPAGARHRGQTNERIVLDDGAQVPDEEVPDEGVATVSGHAGQLGLPAERLTAAQGPREYRTRRAARARYTAAVAAAAPPVPMTTEERPRWRLRWSVTPRAALMALLALALVAGTAVFRSLAAVSGTPVDLAEPHVTASASTAASGIAATTDANLLVHVVGQVAVPGLVELPAGARVSDALDAAGGPLPDADLAALNLAAVVQDGTQIRVPAPGEDAVGTGTADTGTGAGLIDLNRASAAELEELPGVGPVLAARIVEDRQSEGPFTSVDDLDRVSGIGPSVLANLRDQATV